MKENDLAQGEFKQWAKKNCEFDSSTASRFIQAYEQFGDATSHLPSGKIFELISLPDSIDRTDFIEQEHVVPSTGESKKVDDMTVKELREVKKALKSAEKAATEAEQRAKQAEEEKQLAINQHSELQEKLQAQIDEVWIGNSSFRSRTVSFLTNLQSDQQNV